jgi:hypothetical protein
VRKFQELQMSLAWRAETPARLQAQVRMPPWA